MTLFDIEVTIEGPYLTQSSAAGGYGVDAPLARTWRDGKDRAYVPGSLIKGKLLQAWQETGPDDALELLGEKSGNQQDGGGVDPKPARIYFEDLLLQGEAPRKLRHRIKIDRGTGSVEDGALLVMESPFASGAQVRFKGIARLTGGGSGLADKVRKWLEWGLRWTPSLGAERSVGFGRIAGVTVSARDAGRQEPASAINDSFQFSLVPDAPFCVSKQRISGNLFESSTEIPGGAIKGMVARMLLAEAGASGYKVDAVLGQKLTDYKHLCAEFERVRFTHAFPARKQQPRFRPVRAPLSLVKAGDAIHDAAGREKPFLIQGKAPVFQIDWKKEDRKGLEQFGWESLETELRVRTAIDPETLRADDEKLFAYEMVKPDGFEWLGSVDLSKVTIAKAEVAKELATLLSAGLAGLGKTKANVRIECGTKLFEPKIKSRPAATGTQWRITLMTPAILCDPAGISRSSGNGEELLEAYRKWWWKLSGETLELKRFFASQTLAGGYYLFKQFQKTKKEYRPWLLTDAGSVFILDSVKDKQTKAAAFVQTAMDGGLELPGETWETCPFVPENGYGEVAVNLAIQNVELPEQGVTDVDAI